MFDVLIREAGARFGLGDKALPLLQMLLAYMTQKETGGLAGFLEKFKAAGYGPIIQSWLGGGPAAQPIANSQLDTVLGGAGGLLPLLTSRLDVGRDNALSALGYLLPAVVGKLTPGGSIPSSLPPEVQGLAAAGHGLLAAAPVSSAAPPASGGGFAKWLPWIVVVLAALFGVSYLTKDRSAEAPVEAASAPASAAEPAVPAASEPAADAASEPAADAASEPAADAASEPAADAASEPAAEPATGAGADTGGAAATAASTAGEEPTGAAVVASSASEMPALKVYFDSGKTEVHADFAAGSAELVDFMKANPELQAVISGFNDPTGDAAANAELSKQRAQAVQAALVAQGVAEDRTVLEKPAETSGTAATHAASRRVEVVLRR